MTSIRLLSMLIGLAFIGTLHVVLLKGWIERGHVVLLRVWVFSGGKNSESEICEY